MKKDFLNLKRSRWLLLSLFALLVGASPTWAQKALPYSYGFENDQLTLEDGWTSQNPSNLNNTEFGIVGAAKKTGSYGFRFSSYSDKNNNTQYLISPELSAATGLDVTFAYAASSSNGTEVFKVGYSTTDADISSFTWGDEISYKSTSWATYSNTFPAGTKYIAIYYYSNWQYRLYVDDFTFSAPPTCIKPTGLTTTDLTSSSVTLSWTSDADTWNVQYKKAADAEWTDVSGTVTTNPYTLTGLTPGTAYEARVRTYCDASDQSEWTDAISFTTDCATLTIDATHPFSEDFSAGNTLPMCWSINNENKTGGSGWSISSNMAYSGYYGDTYLILPPMQLSVASQLIFDSYFSYVSYYNKSSVVISTTGTSASDFTTTLYTFTNDELPSSSTTALQKEISLAAYTGQTVYIAFKYEGNNAHAWYVDNIVVEEAPSVLKPTALTASNPTWQGATLSWTAGSDETAWKVIYGATGFDPETEGTTVDVTENPYTLTGLTPETAYDVYVKAVKGSDVSKASDKASFTTTERYPAPAGLAISNLTSTSATLTWGAAGQTSWEVAVNTTGTTPDAAGTVVNAATYDFSDLTAETTYYAFVRVKDGENYSAWSAACEFLPSANTYLTVNDGTTTNSYVPVYGYFSATANLGGQFIIPAASLTDVQNKVIKKLTFYSATSEYAYGDAEFDVCLKEVSDTYFPSSSMYAWDETWTTVYSGTLSIVGGKMNITFTSDFNYAGSNLLVGIHKTSTDKSGSNYNVTFYGNNASSSMSNYSPNGNRQKFQPKTTIGYQEKTGSELKVFDGETELAASPASFDFDLAEAGTTHTFTLKNTAATPYVATISSTNLTVSPTEVTPTAEGVTFTVTMPAQTITNEAVVITPAPASGLDPFTINVSGTLRDAAKYYVDGFTAQPNGWTTAGSWSFGSTNGASTSVWNLSDNARLKSPMLTVAAGEKFIFKAKGTASTDYESYQHLLLEYSADGTTWTAIGEEVSLTSAFQTFTVTTPNDFVAGNYYIALHGSQAAVRMFYGGEKVSGANFAINTDGSEQSFGKVAANATAEKTFTVSNNGNKPLFVTISNPADFTAEMTPNAADKYVYFTDALGWGDIYVYYWNNGPEWPGLAMTKLYKNEYNQDVYYCELPDDVEGIIFNGNGNQTVDIDKPIDKAYYTKDEKVGNNYTVGTWSYNNCVPAGESSVLTVTMNTATPGSKSGSVTLSFDALNAKSFTIPCTGFVKDPNALEVDFADGNFPENWQVGANWSVTSGYAVQSQTSLANASAIVTTPLTVAEGETMTFRVARNLTGSSSYKKSLKVRYSQDGGVTWSAYQDYGDEFGSSFAQYELTGVPAGTVIVEFLGNNIKLDDIEGFTKTTGPVLALTESGAAVANGDTKDFGNLVGVDGTATYTITNKGNDDLVATLAGTNVSVSTTNINLAPGANAEVTVTLPYAAGNATGSLAITSTSWVGDMTVNFTSELVDPTSFVEDFTSGQPAGWYNGGWTFDGATASIAEGTAKDLITKKLEAAESKNVLTFKAKYSNEYLSKTLNVYTSADRKAWTLKKEVTLTAEYADVTLDALADGQYYVKFEAANAIIDDVKGLKNVDLPAHDLFEVSNTLTDTAVPGASYTATVTALSLVADESDIVAELWVEKNSVGTKVASLESQTLTANVNKTLTLTGDMPNEEGEYEAWITVKKAGNAAFFNTDRIAFTLAHNPALTINSFTATTPAVQADDNNQYTATFNVKVTNTGSRDLTAGEVSVSLIDKTTEPLDVHTATWTAANSQTVFLNPGEYANDGAVLALYSWGKEEAWTLFTETSIDGFYSAELNGNTGFNIVRLKKSTDDGYSSDNGGLNWSNKYNQSVDYTVADGNVFTFANWDGDKQSFEVSTMSTLAKGVSTTLQVTVSGTLTDGENKNLTFYAREDVKNTIKDDGITYVSQTAAITAAPVITLNEAVGTVASTGENRKVELSRKFVQGWNTICLPFAVAVTDIHADAKALDFTAYNSSTNELTFSPVDALEANKPYVIYVPEDIAGPLYFSGKTVTTAADPETAINGVTFQGTYAPMAAGSLTDMWGLTATGKIAKASSSTTMSGFRAYFDGIPAGATARFVGFDDDVPTGISIVGTDAAAEGAYNLKGQKVEQLRKGGLYIINGKKQVVK